MRSYRRHIVGIIALALASGAGAGFSQSYPSKPVRIIVPVGSGSGLDARTREVAQKLIEYFGQPVVVENRPGAGGILAMGMVARSSPDGYTLVMSGVGTVAYYPSLYRKLPYAAEDFAPVSLLATGPCAVYATPSLPANSVRELIALAKARPGTLTFASQGIGTFQHLSGELFKSIAGIDLLHVPYKEYGQIVTDVESGRISLLFDSTGAVLPHVLAGKLKALAISGSKRVQDLPKVPTFAEAGVPAYVAEVGYGVLAPAKTPQPIINTLSHALARAQASKEIQETIGRFGFNSLGTTPGEFASYIANQRERWSGIIKTTGLQLDY